jgi:tetratricopeptide (TPR) repeat protein
MGYLTGIVLIIGAIMKLILYRMERSNSSGRTPGYSADESEILSRIYEKYEEKDKELIENAFLSSPNNKKALIENIIYYHIKKYKKAISGFKKLLKNAVTNEDKFVVLSFLGLCCQQCNLTDKGIKYYEEALMCKKMSGIYSNLGSLYKKKGMYDKAEELYNKAIDIDRNNATPYNNLAYLYMQRNDMETAIEYANQAAGLRPYMYEAFEILTITHAITGDWESAEKYYKNRTLLYGEESPFLRGMLNSIYAEKFDLDEFLKLINA